MSLAKNAKEESITLEVPELTVEWEDRDSFLPFQEVGDSNDTSLHNLFAILQWKCRKKRALRLATILISLSCILIIGFYLYEHQTTIPAIEPAKLSRITVQNLMIENENTILLLDENSNVISMQKKSEVQGYSCFLLKDQVISWQLSNNQELAYVTSNGLQLVATDVTSFVQAIDGYDVYYTKLNNTEVDFYYFDSKIGSSKLIDSNVITQDYCVSPDGSYVAYLKSATEDDTLLSPSTYCSIYKKNNGIIKNIKDIIPIALSNHLDYFYFVKNKNLYVQTSQGILNQLLVVNSLKDELVVNSLKDDFTLLFNSDYTALQYKANDSWYQSSYGSSGSKINGYSYDGKVITKPYGFYFNRWYNIRTIVDEGFSSTSTQIYREEFRDWTLQVDQYSDGFVYQDYYLSLKNNQVYLTRFDTWDKTFTNIPLIKDLNVEQFCYSFEHEFFYIITREKELYKIDYEGSRTYLTDQAFFIFRSFVNGKEEFYVARDSLCDSTNEFEKMIRSTYLFKLYYCTEENTLKQVDGADEVQIIASSYQISYKDCSKNAENSLTQYYILNHGKGIPIQIPEEEPSNNKRGNILQ